MVVEVGQEIEVDITSLNHQGEGVGRYNGMAVFIPRTCPGDRVKARVNQKHKKFVRAELILLLNESKNRCSVVCSQSHQCGGCHVQHVNYEAQLSYKTELVRQTLARIGKLSGVRVNDTLGMDEPWHYRNKVHFQVGFNGDRLELGFFAEGTHKLVRQQENGKQWAGSCFLIDQDLNDLAAVIEEQLNKYSVDIYQWATRKGLLRHVLLRKAVNTGELMAVFITSSEKWPQEHQFAASLAHANSNLKSVLRHINTGADRQVLGGETITLYGKDSITDKLGHLKFRLSAGSFYQVNPVQTLVLYNKALQFAGLTGQELVVDTYCGVGTIALFLAGHARKLIGLELVPEAVQDAHANAALNKIANVEFQQGAVEKTLPRLARGGVKPDVVVLDPPRRGCHIQVLETLAEMKVPRVVYISCDPGTLARDLGRLAASGYSVVEVQPVDMFPHTAHVEAVVLLQRLNT